jgi:hypothetical protein
MRFGIGIASDVLAGSAIYTLVFVQKEVEAHGVDGGIRDG